MQTLLTGRRFYGSFVLVMVAAAFALAAWSVRAEPRPSQIRITTFNVEWYGLHEPSTPAEPVSEEPVIDRDASLRDFIRGELGESDAILFEEIVDFARLKQRVIGDSMDCVTYDHPEPKHQHVMLCFRKGLRFDREADDDNYAIETLADIGGKARPALSGVLKTADGTPIVHVVGVHLKAYPDQTEKRLTQARSMTARIKQFTDGLPVIALGDFNTHLRELTRLPEDDVVLIDRVFAEGGLGLRLVDNPYPATYRTPTHANKLDQLWVSASLQVAEPATVSWPCNEGGDRGSFRDIADYNRRISDHCPVTTVLAF